MSNGRRRTYSPEISADIEAKLAALTAELDALAAWACDQYDDGDEQFGRRAGVARGRELLAERDALKAKLKLADAHAEECRKATLETLATATARECQAAQREQQLRAALRETREALAYIERSGPGMSWNDVDHYWACSGCGERIVHPWREERHVDHRPECRFAVLASHADLAEGASVADQIITVESIVRDKLKELGADGLCHTDTDCGCGLGDLYPCGEMCDLCRPGYRQTCSRCGIEGYWPERKFGPWTCGDCAGGDQHA